MQKYSKREFVSHIASTGLLTGLPTTAQQVFLAPKAYGQSPDQAHDLESWMHAWIGTKMDVSGALHLQRFKDPIYIVTQPITWVPNPDQEAYGKVTVPKGFVTDFASIPPIFYSLLRPDGDYTYPAIVHDYLYWTQDRTREEADDIFRFGMEDFEISKLKIVPIYEAVRLVGGFAWSGNEEAKAAGEKRILAKFPQDPRITWAQWKARDDVWP